MKIKSWNGEEVEARVGMVGLVKETRFTIIALLPVIARIEVSSNLKWQEAPALIQKVLCRHFTMLHCPFQVGDEIESQNCDDSWLRRLFNESDAKILKDYPDLSRYMRHANQALRDAPEYKP